MASHGVAIYQEAKSPCGDLQGPRKGLEGKVLAYPALQWVLGGGGVLVVSSSLPSGPPTTRQASSVAALQPAVDQAESVCASDTLCVPSMSAKGEPPLHTWKTQFGRPAVAFLAGHSSDEINVLPRCLLLTLPLLALKNAGSPPAAAHPSPQPCGALNQATRLSQLAPALPGKRPSVSLD